MYDWTMDKRRGNFIENKLFFIVIFQFTLHSSAHVFINPKIESKRTFQNEEKLMQNRLFKWQQIHQGYFLKAIAANHFYYDQSRNIFK